ncbi:hypothetical protein MTO96_016008 [Rhipicephalus appendiculatus]
MDGRADYSSFTSKTDDPDLAQHCVKHRDSESEVCSLKPRGFPTNSSRAPPDDFDGNIAGLRHLPLNALEGISFLTRRRQLRE